MKNQLVASAVSAALCSVALSAHATNGDQMMATSAAQAGMGGATIAQAQDALTVLVNPAGMADLGMTEMRMDLGFGLLNPPREVNGQESDSNWYLMPGGGAAFNVNDRLFLGMALGGIAGMGVNVPDAMPAALGNQPVVTTKQVFRFSPAAAFKVNEALALGASLDIAKMEYNTPTGQTSFDMDMPASLGVGLSFKPMPGLQVEFDVKRYAFEDVMESIPVTNPPPGFPAALKFGWEDQTVYAIGVKKDLGKMAVSVGFNYGKSPIGEEDVNMNLGSTAIVEKHLSFGLTRKFSDKVSGAFAYTHAFSNDLTSSVAPYNKIEIDQNQYNFNVSYLF